MGCSPFCLEKPSALVCRESPKGMRKFLSAATKVPSRKCDQETKSPFFRSGQKDSTGAQIVKKKQGPFEDKIPGPEAAVSAASCCSTVADKRPCHMQHLCSTCLHCLPSQIQLVYKAISNLGPVYLEDCLTQNTPQCATQSVQHL